MRTRKNNKGRKTESQNQRTKKTTYETVINKTKRKNKNKKKENRNMTKIFCENNSFFLFFLTKITCAFQFEQFEQGDQQAQKILLSMVDLALMLMIVVDQVF